MCRTARRQWGLFVVGKHNQIHQWYEELIYHLLVRDRVLSLILLLRADIMATWLQTVQTCLKNEIGCSYLKILDHQAEGNGWFLMHFQCSASLHDERGLKHSSWRRYLQKSLFNLILIMQSALLFSFIAVSNHTFVGLKCHGLLPAINLLNLTREKRFL